VIRFEDVHSEGKRDEGRGMTNGNGNGRTGGKKGVAENPPFPQKHAPCFCMTDNTLTTTFDEGRIKT
jgi:hypothetical protein